MKPYARKVTASTTLVKPQATVDGCKDTWATLPQGSQVAALLLPKLLPGASVRLVLSMLL